MLQQTRVDTVIPYYERFVARFPTVQALAEAPAEDVLKLWEGLGYYSRARNLKAAAERVAASGGAFPETAAGLRELPGVGRYTAGAVASIAFGAAEPAVDGNVERVLARLFAIEEDPARPAAKARFEALARGLIPKGEAGDFNQALMELGAVVCTPANPSCLLCPWSTACAARRRGEIARFPAKAARPKPREGLSLAAFVRAKGGRLLVVREDGGGLLAGLWGFPRVEADRPEALRDHLRARFGVETGPLEPRGEARHAFTHVRMTYRAFEAEARGRGPRGSDALRWATMAEIEGLPLSTAMRKVAALLPEGAG